MLIIGLDHSLLVVKNWMVNGNMVGFLLSIMTIILVLVGVLALCYQTEMERDAQKISYKTFLSLYNISPNSWVVDLVCDELKYDGEPIYMRTYYDYVRFILFTHKQRKKYEDIKWAKKRAELIESWNNDINNFVSQEDK